MNEEIFNQEAAQKAPFLTGRRVAWMFYECFKVSDTLNEMLKVELQNDSVQSFNTRWDDTTIAMTKQSDEDWHIVSLPGSAVKAVKAIVVSVHSRYCSKSESRDNTKLNMVVRYLGSSKFVRSDALLKRDKLKSQLLAQLQPKANLRATDTTCGGYVQ